MHADKQQHNAPDLESLNKVRIYYLCEIDINEAGTKKALRWCGGIIVKVANGT